MQENRTATRNRIVAAAADLFYTEGIAHASMEALAGRAGVTKRTLYHHFRSKDDIVAAWLAVLDEAVRSRYERWFHAVPGRVETRLRHMFLSLAEHARDPRWKGCGFARAASELAGLPGHPGVRVAQAHRKGFEAWFARELAEDGVAEPERTARRLMLLLDGAIMQALLHHDPAYMEEAAETAVDLVRAQRVIAPAPAAWGRVAAASTGR
jgi:AcrR family transcriptional regulator